MNLGQSTFQDTVFVAGAQLTPYRRLRQIELELRQIDDSLARNSFALRRLKLKIAKLNPDDPEQAIELDEANWDLKQQEQLRLDSISRQQNFYKLKEETLRSMPQEYWDAGFEANEQEHWTLYLTKQLTLARATGAVDKNAVEMTLLMPPESQERIMVGVAQQFLESRITILSITIDSIKQHFPRIFVSNSTKLQHANRFTTWCFNQLMKIIINSFKLKHTIYPFHQKLFVSILLILTHHFKELTRT